MMPRIRAGLGDDASVEEKARAGYLAICLDLAGPIRSRRPQIWTEAIAALEKQPELLEVMFSKSPGPAGDKLRAAALAAGLRKPERQRR